jgi:hypothetical protein
MAGITMTRPTSLLCRSLLLYPIPLPFILAALLNCGVSTPECFREFAQSGWLPNFELISAAHGNSNLKCSRLHLAYAIFQSQQSSLEQHNLLLSLIRPVLVCLEILYTPSNPQFNALIKLKFRFSSAFRR